MNPVELAFRAVWRDRRSRCAASLTAISSVITASLVIPASGVPFLPLSGVVVLLALSSALFGAAARWARASRQHRLVALRLSGATPSQQVALVAVEVVPASAVGTLGGILLVRPLRSLAMRIPRGGGTWFASELALSPAIIAAVGVGVPLLALCVALLGVRPETDGHGWWR